MLRPDRVTDRCFPADHGMGVEMTEARTAFPATRSTLMHRVVRGSMSNRQREFIEHDLQPAPYRCLDCQLVVASPEAPHSACPASVPVRSVPRRSALSRRTCRTTRPCWPTPLGGDRALAWLQAARPDACRPARPGMTLVGRGTCAGRQRRAPAWRLLPLEERAKRAQSCRSSTIVKARRPPGAGGGRRGC
jgi:hypothetical protein